MISIRQMAPHIFKPKTQKSKFTENIQKKSAFRDIPGIPAQKSTNKNPKKCHRSTHTLGATVAGARGTGGPMSVSDGSYVTDLAERWSSACAEAPIRDPAGEEAMVNGKSAGY